MTCLCALLAFLLGAALDYAISWLVWQLSPVLAALVWFFGIVPCMGVSFSLIFSGGRDWWIWR